MRALTAVEVLSVWERTRGQQPLRQALEWLACASPRQSIEQWAARPVGEVCRSLFQLRVLMFGPEMPGIAQCPACGERVEFAFQCQDLLPELPTISAPDLLLEPEGRAVAMRLPTAEDLLAVRSGAELLARCTGGVADPALLAEASTNVAEMDPLSETMLDLTCPACSHGWQALLDIASYLGREISHYARRLLTEVHHLALVYGWSESEILALSPARRRVYLEMAGA